MMAQRSLIRPTQLTSDGAYQFAQLTLDGYSGGDEDDGYLTALVLVDRQTTGNTTLTIDSTNGAINQTGTGQVSFAGNVNATNGLDVTGANLTVALDALVTGNVVITGDLTVNGTETVIHTEDLYVKDPIIVVNDSLSEVGHTWTGISAGDADGYNRIGWTFDGYWALSSAATAGSDTPPDRAIAYVGSAFTNGDLSTTTDGASGADKVAVTPISGLAGASVQTCLENLASGSAEITGTTHLTFTINSDATAVTDEDPCVILKGGDGTSLIEGYMCLITGTGTNDDYFQFRIYDDGAPAHSKLYIGEGGGTTDVDAYLVLNSGNGSTARQATIALDGTANQLNYTANAHSFSGSITAQNDVTVTGVTTLNGNTVIGSDSGDSVDVNGTIISDLLPTDCTYQLGNASNKWNDGYFCLFTPTNYTPVGDNSSLEGHLKGIDTAIGGVVAVKERGVYVVTTGEASTDIIDSSRAVQQGAVVDVSGLTDAQFRDSVYIYFNGQLLRNDPTPAVNKAAVQFDVARQTGTLKNLIFAGNLRKNYVVQIVDMR